MESYGDSMTCDEYRGPECGPCSRRVKMKAAEHYCKDCPDYLCGDCKDYHGNIKGTRNHDIEPVNKISTPVSRATGSTNEKSSNNNTSMLNSVLAEIKTIVVNYERLKQKSPGRKERIYKLAETCKKEIKQFRKELDTIFDNLERNSLREVDKWRQDENRHVEQNDWNIEAALKVLKVGCRRIEDAKIDGNRETMLTAEIQSSKTIHDYTLKLAKLEKDIDINKPTLAFERNECLADMLAGINTLGSLKTQRKVGGQENELQDKPSTTISAKILKDKKVKSHSEVNIRTEDDEKSPWITGCAVMPTGHIVLCEKSNNKIKLLDDSWAITDQMKLQRPWDVAVIDASKALVSLPDTQQLQEVQVFPKMKTGRTIQLDKRCYGVAINGDEIYTTCHDSPGESEVRVLDLQYNIKRRLQTDKYGSKLFIGSPFYISVSTSGERVFVADWSMNTITCLTSSGTVIYTYKHREMTGPRGLICDSGDNVLVCGCNSRNIHIISPDGKKISTLLTSKDGLKEPDIVVYKESEDMLIIGCWESDKLLLFKLE